MTRRKRRLVITAVKDSLDSNNDENSKKAYPLRIYLYLFSVSIEVLKQYLIPTIPACIFILLFAAHQDR